MIIPAKGFVVGQALFEWGKKRGGGLQEGNPTVEKTFLSA